jgi:hypothetical protein
MQLRDLISTEYEGQARIKPNVVIHNYANMLRVLLASFSRNMYEGTSCVLFPIRRVLRRQPSQNKPKRVKCLIINRM